MNKQKSVKINMMMNAFLTMSSIIFPIITFPYVSRILLPIGTGKINFAISVVTYFSMFAQLGIPTYGIRACAKVRDNKEELSRTVQELLTINVFMCFLVYIVFGISLVFVPRFRQERALLLVISVSIILNAMGVEWLYKALEQYTYITFRSIIFKFIALIAMFIFVHQKSDYIKYGAISIFAASASNLLNFSNLKKYVSLRPTGNYHFKNHISMVITFFSMSVATTIYTNLDNVMLGFMKTDEDVGFYSVAVKIKQVLVSLVTSTSAVLLPRATYYVDKGMLQEFYRIIRKTMHFIILLALPLTVFFIIFAREGIFFLSGEAYENSILPMKIIMPTLVFIGMTNVIGVQLLVPLGLEKQVLYSEIAGAVTDLLLNIILIPRFSAVGAAVGTLIAEMVVLIWQLKVIRQMGISIFSEISVWKIVLAIIISSIACLGIRNYITNHFLILVISFFVFFVLYGTILLIVKESLLTKLLNHFSLK